MKWYCDQRFENNGCENWSLGQAHASSKLSDMILISPRSKVGSPAGAGWQGTQTTPHRYKSGSGKWVGERPLGSCNVLSSPECWLHKCVCSVKIQWAAHLGQMHYIFLGIRCTHFSRYILHLNKVFKIHGIRCITISALFFQTHDGFQLTRVIIYNLRWKSLMKIIQIFNLKTSRQTTVTFQG